MRIRSRNGGRIPSALVVVSGALLALLVTGITYEQVRQRRDRRRLPQVGESVDVGGRRLNVFCSGAGSPVVIFDAGNGSPGYAWSRIQPEIATLTRACWFDRAGYGWSDPGPFPQTSSAMSKDLHALVHGARLPTPFVYVGHSLGGLNARVYNGLYPTEVAGAVLVDAAHEDEPKRAPKFMLGHSAPRALWRPIWLVGQSARIFGLTRLLSSGSAQSSDPSQLTSQQLLEALRRQPKTLAAQFDPSVPDSYAEAERAGGFGDRPLVVLTRGRIELPSHPSERDVAAAAYEHVWQREIQPKLARLSSRGRQVIVEQSGHGIPDEAPEAVVAAVKEVVLEVRGLRAPAPAPSRVSRPPE